MEYDTILVRDSVCGITITLNRLEHQNSLNHVLLKEMNDVLDLAEQDANCRIVVLEGQKSIFCTGMDFAEVASSNNQAAKRSASDPYMETIKRLTLIPKIIISVIDGQVMAGGVGEPQEPVTSATPPAPPPPGFAGRGSGGSGGGVGVAVGASGIRLALATPSS